MKSFPLRYQPDIPWRLARAPFSMRVQAHVRELEAMRDAFDRGADLLQSHAGALSEDAFAQENLLALMYLGRFVARCAQDHCQCSSSGGCKRRVCWLAQSMQETEQAVAALREIGQREIENVRAAIEPVRADSRLGWCGRLRKYVCDEALLRWKVKQVQGVA